LTYATQAVKIEIMNECVTKWNDNDFKGIKSLGKATAILKALSADIKKLSDIARYVNLSKSTTHRLLRSLIDEGLAAQDPFTEEYYLGPLLFKLISNPIQAHQILMYRAYPVMDELRQFTGETTNLDIKLGNEKYNLMQLPSPKNIAFIARPPGNIDLLWTGSIGKVLLAQLPEDEFEIILDNLKLTPLTPNTIVDKQAFKQEIAKVRQRGYATSFGETDISVVGIAAPIENYSIPASLSIIGPETRLAPKIMNFVDELKKKASEISLVLLKDLQKL
jgi:DNA-binding IclR family transcriptional regulator